jgi:glycosyltransferase involved in cell wall biosynthesis
MNASLSVFFPAYNDSFSIAGLVHKTFEVLAARGLDFEVIVVNDGSQDETGAVLRRLAATHGARLRVVEHRVNRGYGAALRSGFAAATKELVFYTDGDGQYDVGELPLLLDKLEPGVGLVNGYKLQRHDPWHRVCIGAIYNRFARLLFGIRLRDIDCDFRLIRREVLRDLELESDTGTICVELVRKIESSSWRVAEVGVHHYPRLHGRSQFFRLPSLMRTFRQLLALYCKLALPAMPWIGRRKPCERMP